METASGTLLAVCVDGASCDPKTLMIIPGEKVEWKDATVASPVIVGVPLEREEFCTLTESEAETPLKEASTTPLPCESCDPVTVKVAVAAPADPTRFADPSELPPIVNVTAPAGVLPLELVTVAIRYTVSENPAGLRLLTSVTVSAGGGGGVTAPPAQV